MNIDDRTIYVFVRDDLAVEQQIVQASHAVFHMSGVYFRNFGCSALGIPRVIVLQALSAKALNKAIVKLREAQIGNVQFTDPDNPQFGTSAVATEPLTQEKSLPLANYRLWRYSPPSVASAEVALDGQRGANAPVAQETEHSTFSREVAGEIPAGSSTSVNCS